MERFGQHVTGCLGQESCPASGTPESRSPVLPNHPKMFIPEGMFWWTLPVGSQYSMAWGMKRATAQLLNFHFPQLLLSDKIHDAQLSLN